MDLNEKEKTIALIANAIAAYSLKKENNSLPENISLIDFILNSIPAKLKPKISIELIDDVFEFVSSAHNS